MPQLCWNATARGEYWIDVSLGGHAVQVLVDTGLIDGKGRVGFSIEESLYDAIKRAKGFQKHQQHARLTADGRISMAQSGSLDAQLICPLTRSPVGPVVHVYVYRGVPGVPNRVGAAFFYLLKGCRVIWDFDQRQWCIEYP
jgi:hypothetical protein